MTGYEGQSDPTGFPGHDEARAGKFYAETKDIIFGDDFVNLPKPSEIAPPPFHGLFGMCEMECAAEVIMKRCLSNDSWYHQFGLDDFRVYPYTCCRNLGWHEHGFGGAIRNPEYRGDRGDTLASDGFLHLLSGGVLCSSYPNSVFRLTRRFVERMSEHTAKRTSKR